ncbi:MAG: glycoside hydrolase family 25 protein [Firmicutes bacterium]|nr:glycoside hydrolase family 25 protein [Bacillota bacterium]
MDTMDTFSEGNPDLEPEEIPEHFPELIVDRPQSTGGETVAILDEVYPPAPPKRRLRPEWILGLIALAAAMLLIVVAVFSRPYYAATDDPEALVERHHPEELTQPEDLPEPEPEPPETEPTVPPTIPPDPNPYGRLDFQYNHNNYLTCLRTDSYAGVDVSAFQGSIDWTRVARSGIDFAIIRLGYRGYGSGKLVEDDYAKKNLKGATEAGLPIGAYFFSQALSMDEAEEEIQFMLDILGDYRLDMPVVLDWEIPAADARTANMDARTLTDIQRYFCEKMKSLGYQPMVYFNWHQSENLYYLSELEDYPFWLAMYQDRMSFPWKVEMWQYTCTGKVPGIPGDVDINVYMP